MVEPGATDFADIRALSIRVKKVLHTIEPCTYLNQRRF